MGEIKIQVTPSKPQNLEVGTKNTKNAVEITQDQKHYWEWLAKEWAIKMSGLVQGVDYSSKYWANEAKKSSDIATASIETNSNLTEILNQNYQTYLNDLTDEHTQALFDINTQKEAALTEINTTTNNNVDNLNNITNTATNNIEKISDQSLTNISNAESTAIENIEQTAGQLIQGASRNIGEKVFSFLPLDDAGLHLLDGSLLEGQGSYRAFVQYIAKLYQNDGGTPPAYFVTEEEYQTSITKYGVCGKFVYDSEANTVRLPKVTGIVEGTLDANALGDLVQAGLPDLQLTTASAGAHTHSRGTMNITGNIYSRGNIAGNYSGEITGSSGAFSQTRKNGPDAVGMKQSTDTNSKTDTTNFDASKSWTGSTSSNGAHTHAVNVGNTLVGNSDSVQPQTVKGFMYMVVANATKTDIEVDIDNVMTDLNGKADTDLKNLTEAGESHFDSKYLGNNQRTNCLTEIPDRIKYTLNNGTFTLKAGSVIIVPFGTEAPTLTIGDFLEGASNNNNFKIVDIQYKNNQLFYWCEVQNDIVETGSSTGTPLRFIAVTISGSNLENWITWNAKTSSADTLPSDTNSYMWYQPGNNKVVHTLNNTAHTVDRLLSLPFAIVQGGNGYVFNNIYEVFNGMGNIGGIHWVDKGVKGLIPYYRNEDKSLKSINFIQTELTLSINRSNQNSLVQQPVLGQYQEDTGCIVPYQMLANNYYYESDVQPNVTNQYAVWYDTYNNIYKATNDIGVTWIEGENIKLGYGVINSGVLKSSYNAPFQAFDGNNKFDLTGLSFPSSRVLKLSNGGQNSTYTAPANGFVHFRMAINPSSAGYISIQTDTMGINSYAPTSYHPELWLPVRKNEVFKINYATGMTTVDILEFVYAEGTQSI